MQPQIDETATDSLPSLDQAVLPAPAFTELERSLGSSLFSPLFYALSTGTAVARDRDAAIDEILASTAAIATSPLFDPAIYAARLALAGVDLALNETTSLAHWLKVGRLLRIVPNDLFDEAYYLETYEDVAALQDFGFCHFLLWGIYEGRLPNDWFDPEAYSRLNGTAAGQAPFSHYVEVGAALGAVLPRRQQPELLDQPAGPVAEAARAEALHAAEPMRTELRRIFLPQFYARRIGRADADPEALWTHYLEHGLSADEPPHVLFDPHLYARQIEELALPPRAADEPLVLHWLSIGQARRVIPTHFFDEAFYEAVYPDLGGQKLGFLHYLSDGMKEGRAPTIWFDQHWYSNRYGDGVVLDYAHFVTEGLAQGFMPSILVEHIIRTFAPGHPITREIYDLLLSASSSWQGAIPVSSLWLLLALYVPAWHESDDRLGHFLSYLNDGMQRDVLPGPLFDPAIYRQRAHKADLPPLEDGASATLHWLQYGCEARIVPTERFDESFYRRSNPDIDRSSSWGFAHFICNGVFEGRAPSNRPAFRLASVGGDENLGMPALYRQWHAADFPDYLPSNLAARSLGTNQARLEALLKSEALKEAFAAAQAVEPAVGDAEAVVDYLLPPFHAQIAGAHAELRRRIPQTHYDSVVCVPWVRTGGADLVAGLLAKALLRVRPSERILVLRTDQPHFERANWLPEQADVTPMADLAAKLTPVEAQNLLRTVLRGVTAKRVFNVNSRLCWLTMREHGENLAAELQTYAYMFCWDQTPSGLRTGYPAEFFADTTKTMTAFLTDTSYLRDELTAMYRLPEQLTARIRPFHTPAQTAVRATAVARLSAQAGARPPLVLWAGRLDRQKRFDLVQEIARRMPDVAFHCWGAALLDSPPDLTRLPSNVTMMGSFDRFDDLPLEQAHAWLFTAAWEGMPTTIIELATRGMAIVASAVGGVPELIRTDTGWPIAADAGATAYVTALRDILDHPEDAASRAEMLQRLVGERYTEVAYDADLRRLLDAEDA